MDKKRFYELMAQLYSAFNRQFDEYQVRVYYSRLAMHNPDEIERAILYCMDHETFFPPIGKIMSAKQEVQLQDRPDLKVLLEFAGEPIPMPDYVKNMLNKIGEHR